MNGTENSHIGDAVAQQRLAQQRPTFCCRFSMSSSSDSRNEIAVGRSCWPQQQCENAHFCVFDDSCKSTWHRLSSSVEILVGWLLGTWPCAAAHVNI